MLRKENDAFRQENRLLRDKIGTLTFELENHAGQSRDETMRQVTALEGEIGHLRNQLAENERETRRLRDQVDDRENGT
jgi:hypothetical protein